ncbi:MAG: ATP synthase F0 subunit B, partial [Candidatus Puniceispirillaceae bacterium]
MEGIVMESVWVAVGFAVFVALVWKKAGAALSGMLDERSTKIRAELDEARALREEALDELHQFQRL